MTNRNTLLEENPEPSLLDAIEHASKPKRRVRIVQDSDPSDPRTDMDLMCEIRSLHRREYAAQIIAELIRDTQAWMAVERIAVAATPPDEWYDDRMPDIEGKPSVRDQWLDNLKDCLLVQEFSTGSCTYVAHTTPEMCAKLGVEWANAHKAMNSEVEMFKRWAEGDMYGFVVEHWEPACSCDDCEAGEWVEEDSCWGFYGTDWFTNGMSDNIDKELHDQLRSAKVEYN